MATITDTDADTIHRMHARAVTAISALAEEAIRVRDQHADRIDEMGWLLEDTRRRHREMVAIARAVAEEHQEALRLISTVRDLIVAADENHAHAVSLEDLRRAIGPVR